ncbi:uncharacterized protein V6R79_011551 [Siganus canaliculatus]
MSRHQSGSAIKSPASTRGSNASQSSTGSSEEDRGQTASQEQICFHLPAQTHLQQATFTLRRRHKGCRLDILT